MVRMAEVCKKRIINSKTKIEKSGTYMIRPYFIYDWIKFDWFLSSLVLLSLAYCLLLNFLSVVGIRDL